jgi:hypothetical protein
VRLSLARDRGWRKKLMICWCHGLQIKVPCLKYGTDRYPAHASTWEPKADRA